MKTLEKKDWLRINSFLQNSKHPLDTIIQCALETGARVSEVVGVKPSLVVDGYLKIKALKGSNNRTVPISPNLEAKIKSLPSPFPDVFSLHSIKVKAENRRRIIDRRFRWICAHLFIHPVGLHTLRHTLCSELYRETKNICLVRDFIGHKSINSTLRYQHLNQKEEAENIVKGILG